MDEGSGIGGRRALGCVIALAFVLGCDGGRETREDPSRRPRCDIGGLASCKDSSSCGGKAVCFEGCCLAACASTSDCEGASGCDDFGCVCDQGACIPTSCSASSECEGGRSCVGGSCVEVQEVEASSCNLSPPWAAVRAGDEVRYSLRAFDARGERIVPTPAFRLETSDPNLASASGDRVVGGNDAGTVEVIARLGAITCSAELESHGEVAEDDVRILVVDALSRLPIQGARVQVETGGAPLLATTDGRGEAVFERAAVPSPRTISVFHEDYTYVSIFGLTGSDHLVPLSPNPETPLAGGFSGAFESALFEPSRLNFGLAGASLPGNLIDVDVSILVGPIERVEIDVGGARSADLSAGLVFGLGNTWFKERYRVEALPGACEDRAASEEGRCGFRTAWGLAGGIPLEDVPFDAIQSQGEVNAGKLLAEFLPQVRRLRSAVVPSFPIEPLPRVDGKPDWARLPRLDLDAEKRLSLRVDVSLSPLPSDLVDGVIALVGAKVEGEGMVPLGLTGAVAEEGTGELVDPARGRRGVLDLRFAPMHGGIEGSEYVVFVIAVNLEGLSGGASCAPSDRSGCTPISGLVASARSLPWGTEVDLANPGFLGFADQALFDPAGRRLEVGRAVDGATLVRLEVVSRGKAWQIYFPAASSGVTVPVPADVPDRMEDPSASLQVMDADLDLDALTGPGGADLSDFTLRARRFSTMDLPRLTPSN